MGIIDLKSRSVIETHCFITFIST